MSLGNQEVQEKILLNSTTFWIAFLGIDLDSNVELIPALAAILRLMKQQR